MGEIIALFIPIVAIGVTGLTILGGIYLSSTGKTRRKELEVRRIEALARLVDASARIGEVPLSADQRESVAAEIEAALDGSEGGSDAPRPVPMRVEKEL